jgi:predicted aspartyl protease
LEVEEWGSGAANDGCDPRISVRGDRVCCRRVSFFNILAYVDTGFDGYLIIPATQTSLLGAPQFSAPWELGDGSVVQAHEYRGDILVSGLTINIPARITLLGEEYLVGRGVVDHLRMIFDHGQRLLLEA